MIRKTKQLEARIEQLERKVEKLIDIIIEEKMAEIDRLVERDQIDILYSWKPFIERSINDKSPKDAYGFPQFYC